MRPNKLECLHLPKTFQSSLTFVGSTGSLPKKEASERSSNWVCPQVLRPDGKGLPRANPLAYLALLSVTKEKSFITLTLVYHAQNRNAKFALKNARVNAP
jgi:hypothetical protein